jgi:hypothetical protein
MGVPFGAAEPLPGVAYTGTMSTADIYPTHVGIGGIRTQDRAIPAFADATAAAHQRAFDVASMPAGLFNSPAGWFALILAGLIVATWVHK